MTSTTPTKMTRKIKIFLDGADRSSMIETLNNPLISGFTTNPSLMRKAGINDYRGFCQEILTQVKSKPISFEVFADDMETMKVQALEIASWEKPGNQLYVKIPVLTSDGKSTQSLVKDLSHRGVKLNVTAIYTVQQVQETCDAVKGGVPSIVSVFAGRMADVGIDPLPIMKEAAEICAKAGPQVELLWASTREAYNVIQAEETGCKIITAPIDVVKKVAGFGSKTLQELSRDTVMTFKKDSEAAGFKL